METNSQRKYVALMEEIKYRANVIELFGNNPSFGVYRQTRIEFICLQLRLIIENVAMSCLVANGDDLDEVSKKITNEYRPEPILRCLDAINPLCYPKPVTLIDDGTNLPALPVGLAGDRYVGEVKERSGHDWLTRDQMKEVYGRLGQILHAANPMKQSNSLEYFEVESLKWYHQIVNLVTHHKVTVLNDRTMYIVVVGHAADATPTSPGAKVQMVEFHKTDDSDATVLGATSAVG